MTPQSTDQNFDSEDFQEAPHMPRDRGYHPIVLGVGGALLGLILAIVFISGSLPEMSPEQIVAMEGYQGEQPPRYIFNLDSLGGSNALPSAASISVPGAALSSASSELSGVGSSHASNALLKDAHLEDEGSAAVAIARSAVRNVGLSAADMNAGPGNNLHPIDNLLAIKTEEPKDSWSLEIVEVPASPIIVGKDAQEVAAPIVEEFDYRKLNRRPATSAQQSDVLGRVAVQSVQNESSTTIRVLPVLTVNTDNTYVRAEPTQSSDVKLVLARGSSVTAFEQAGAWVHVGANDGSSITGYVHRSKIAITEIN